MEGSQTMTSAIFRAIKNFFDCFSTANEVERYLAKSVDRADLERRIRKLQREGKI
jgi:hypothetical protein